MFAYKDLKNILSNANLLVVLLITLSTKAKMITPKKLRFCDFIYHHPIANVTFVSYMGVYFFFHFCKGMVDISISKRNKRRLCVARRSSHIHIAPMQIIFNEHPIGKLEKFIAVFHQSVKSLNN